MTAPLRWGILGAGDVCEVKSGPAFQKAQGAELAAVMRRDGEKAADFARRHQVGKWYDSVESLLGDPDIDAVYIATPPRYHMEHCLAALAAGKHVYLEKPMALNASECAAIIEAEAKAEANRILSASLSDKILRDKGIDATVQLAESENAKIVVVGGGSDGLPLILNR